MRLGFTSFSPTFRLTISDPRVVCSWANDAPHFRAEVSYRGFQVRHLCVHCVQPFIDGIKFLVNDCKFLVNLVKTIVYSFKSVVYFFESFIDLLEALIP